jgi:hypothetical protein
MSRKAPILGLKKISYIGTTKRKVINVNIETNEVI